MKSAAEADPEIGNEFAEQAAELKRTRHGIMFPRAELATDPLQRFTATGALRSAKYDRTALRLKGERYR